MYRLGAIPFVLLIVCAIGALWDETSAAFGVGLIVAFVACLGVVPILSRKSLALGYVGLVLPFLLALIALLAMTPVMTPRGQTKNPMQSSKAPDRTAASATPPASGSEELPRDKAQEPRH